MRAGVVAALGAALWLVGSATQASAVEPVRAQGEFTAAVDFSTLTLTPVGRNCLLRVDGELEFTGTIEGLAAGTTSALLLASCDDVAVTPPGTFKDVFRSRLEFWGTVDGEPVIADLTYQGITQVGGGIRAVFRFSNGLRGVLKVDAIVAVGGSYKGIVLLD